MWKVVMGVAGLVGLYHLIAHTLQKPVYGVSNLLNGVGRRLFARSLRAAELEDRFDIDKNAKFKAGRMSRLEIETNPAPGKLV
jgi:hypothetical protein